MVSALVDFVVLRYVFVEVGVADNVPEAGGIMESAFRYFVEDIEVEVDVIVV